MSLAKLAQAGLRAWGKRQAARTAETPAGEVLRRFRDDVSAKRQECAAEGREPNDDDRAEVIGRLISDLATGGGDGD